MGTRHIIAVAKDNEYKLAQYGQWDGYPSGQGAGVLSFLKANKLEVFAEKLSNVSYITEEELKQRWVEAGAAPDEEWVTLDVSRKMAEMYPENVRDTGSDILGIILNAERPIKVTNSIDFAADSVFCEWGYVIDLDKNTFEVFRGFNHDPLTESDRFYNLDKPGEFHPIKLLKSYDLNNLPSEEDFVEELDKLQEEAIA